MVDRARLLFARVACFLQYICLLSAAAEEHVYVLRFQPAVKDDLSQFTRFPPQSCPLCLSFSPSPSVSTLSRPLPVQFPPIPRIQDWLQTYSHFTGTSSCEAFGCRRGRREKEEEKKESFAIRQEEHGGSLCSLEVAWSNLGALGGGMELTQFGVLLRLASPGWRIPPRASAPDGSSPGTASWPGHFLSRGLVLIKARANSNAPFLPSASLHSLSLFYSPSPL